MENFQELDLPEPLQKALARMKFETPTPIQAQAIPLALQGRDILGSAQTGTGKTGAFGIPLVAHLQRQSRGTALIMTPTRELAAQVADALKDMLGRYSPIKAALLIGGESMPKQVQQLRARPRLIIGTPGRINDHLERGNLMLHDTGFLVLDETDRMLDMGFTDQIKSILKYMPQKRQTLLFSATLPKNIVKLSEDYLHKPVRVAVKAERTHAANIEHEVIELSHSQKYEELLKQLKARTGSVIVFVKTKYGAEKMAARLRKSKQSAEAIHGDLRQSRRDKVIQAFRDSRHRILVATDIAARGLDIPHIEHVINYDLPQAAEDYIHRIGRTARAGADGEAICFVTPDDKGQWEAIDRLMHPEKAPAKKKPGKKAFDSKKPYARRRPRRHERRKSSGGNAGSHNGGAPKKQSA